MPTRYSASHPCFWYPQAASTGMARVMGASGEKRTATPTHTDPGEDMVTRTDRAGMGTIRTRTGVANSRRRKRSVMTCTMGYVPLCVGARVRV